MYLGWNIRAGVNSYAIPIDHEHPLHEILSQGFAEGYEEITVYRDGKYWGTFDGTDRARLSAGKRHTIVRMK